MTANNTTFLNEKGLEVLQLKRAMRDFSNNAHIYNGLVDSIKTAGYEIEIVDALLESKCTDSSLETKLLAFDSYTNMELIKKAFSDYMKKISAALERKGQKHFSSVLSLQDGGIKIFKKVGFNSNFLRKEFRLTEKDVKKIIKDGFAEKYAQLKLNSILKNMQDAIESKFGKNPLLSFTVSPFYIDEGTKFYNMDFNIIIKASDELISLSDSKFKETIVSLNEILNILEKEYHKKING